MNKNDTRSNEERVVITGMGTITPVGETVETYWKSLLIGKSGIGKITLFDPSRLRIQIAERL